MSYVGRFSLEVSEKHYGLLILVHFNEQDFKYGHVKNKVSFFSPVKLLIGECYVYLFGSTLL